MKFLFHAIVCHVLVGDTGEKRVAEKIAKCCIRERKKGVGGVKNCNLRVTYFLNDLKRTNGNNLTK